MIKKLAVIVFFLGVIALLSAPVFAEENTTAKPADTSAQKPEVAPTNEAVAPTDEEALPAEQGVGEGVVTGEITSLDAAKGVISVKGADGAEKAFNVVDGETILWKGIEDIKLSDVKKGDKAEVGYYTDDAGKLIASWVDVVVPEQPAAATNSPAAPATTSQVAPAAPAATNGQ